MSQIGVYVSGTGSPPIEKITGNTGMAVPTLGNVNIVGDGTTVITTGASDTLTIAVASATTTNQGIVELATDAESIAGTDGTRSIVPSSLKAKLGVQTSNGIAYGADTTSAVQWTAAGTDGQLIIAASANPPAFGTLTSSDGSLTIATGPNTLDITITVIPAWTVVTGATQAIASNKKYFANNAGTVTFTLPATSAVGDTYEVAGMNNATGWTIAQRAGQTIHLGTSDTTTGVGGSLSSTATYDWVEIVCNIANTDFVATARQGNITVV